RARRQRGRDAEPARRLRRAREPRRTLAHPRQLARRRSLRFITSICNAAAKRWREPDAGLWEWRGRRLHFTHSKVMCWAALDRGLALAEESMREAPRRRWQRARAQIGSAVESDGYDKRRGIFRQVFGRNLVDASL